MAAALSADDVTLELEDGGDIVKTDLVTEENVDRPRSGKEARQRRAERIASASALTRTSGDEAETDDQGEEDEPLRYEEYER